MKKILFTFICILMVLAVKSQQLSRRTQFPYNAYMINPATAGTQMYTPIIATYRNQWAGWDHAPKTYTLSGHTGLANNLGVGGIFFKDDSGGAISRTGVELTGAYRVDLNNVDAISFGLSAVLTQFKFDNSKLVVYEPDDQALLGDVNSQFNFDTNFGFLVYGPNYFFGASVPQLMQTKLNLESLVDPSSNKNRRHYYLSGSYKYIIDDTWDIQPAALVKFTGQTPVQIDLHVKANYADLVWAGLSYRAKDAVALLVGFQFSNAVLNYSYDITTSGARVFSPHTHEISIGYLIQKKRGTFANKSLLGPRRLERFRIFN